MLEMGQLPVVEDCVQQPVMEVEDCVQQPVMEETADQGWWDGDDWWERWGESWWVWRNGEGWSQQED